MSTGPALSTNEYLTFTLANQMFGIAVLQVNDVLGTQKITRTPLSPPAVSGVMNLRGRIVTAIDVRCCLGQKPRENAKDSAGIVIEQGGELFSLIIDSVSDVIALDKDSLENVPATLDPAWRGVASGIYKLQDRLLVVLDVKKLLAMVDFRTDREREDPLCSHA